jgi:hypothetical protein
VKRMVVVAGAAVVMVVMALCIWNVNRDRDPNQGWDTTCRDLVAMTPTQRVAVMKESGVDPDYLDARAKFYARSCMQHPEDHDYPIGDIGP